MKRFLGVLLWGVCVLGNTETVLLHLGQESDDLQLPSRIFPIDKAHLSNQIEMDFNLEAYRWPQEGETKRYVFEVMDPSLDNHLLKVCWSAIHPVDVELESFGRFVEMKVKTNAYSKKDIPLNVKFNVDIMNSSNLISMVFYLVISLLLGILMAAYVIWNL